MRLLLAFLFTVTQATAGYEDEPMACYGTLVPPEKICDDVGDCVPPGYPNHGHLHFPQADFLADEDKICAPLAFKTRRLELSSETLANRSLRFTWRWSAVYWENDDDLAGYYFRANSTEGTFRETLSPQRTDFYAYQLRGNTTYDIFIRPFFYAEGGINDRPSSFYDDDDDGYEPGPPPPIPTIRGTLGKATTLTVRTPVPAPGAPRKIVPLPPTIDQANRWGELALAVTGPEAWNSKPLGFHLRWEPAEEGQTAERGFTFPYLVSGRTPTSYDLNVTLSLSPGQEYTVFASARGLGDYGEVLVGPETSVKIETSHMAPKYLLENTVQLTSQAYPNGSLIFSWTWSEGSKPAELAGFHFQSVSEEHTFNATLSRVDTDFSPALLRPYTEYEIMLKPFYVLNGLVIDTEKLGKPARMRLRTPAAAPGAPTAIVPLPTEATYKQDGQLSFAILEPVAWNSKPQGFHLRWEPAEEEGQAGLDIAIPAMAAANETKKKHAVNATLMLKPGRQYTVFVSARGLGDNGEVHIGPETLMTVETAPLAPVNFKSELVDPNKVILTWSASSPARSFQITVADCGNSENDCNNTHDENTLQRKPSNTAAVPLTGINTFIRIDGSTLPSSSYILPVFGLTPSRVYAVRIKACVRDTCSNEVGTVFRTPPSVIPAPRITKILSNDSKSIYLEWNCPFMEKLLALSPEFQVRVRAPDFFRSASTTKEALLIGNLSPSTSYEVEVRMSLEVAPGKRKYGVPVEAKISTWSEVPLAPTLTTEGFETAPNVVALEWTFVNSSVTHVEFSVDGTPFVNCGSANHCAVVVLYGWDSSFKAGFVHISGLSPYKRYDIAFRGCNAHGCGGDTRVRVTTAISEPGTPADLELNRTHLTWRAPADAAGPLNGYWIFWSCDHGPTTSAITRHADFLLSGLPSQAEECTFSVSAYNVLENGEELHGKPATLKTALPARL